MISPDYPVLLMILFLCVLVGVLGYFLIHNSIKALRIIMIGAAIFSVDKFVQTESTGAAILLATCLACITWIELVVYQKKD